MGERRNLYRLLHLQPDAPSELVRVNYLTLMTKLERHPDLGGDHWNAASLGAAYTTLNDPKKRAIYDEQLLERYDLRTLAKGSPESHSIEGAHPSPRPKAPRLDPDGNLRNYYRVLGVQQDAPGPVIKSAYRALHARSTSLQERALLDSAFCVLCDSEWRARYDEIQQHELHPSAAHEVRNKIRDRRESERTYEQQASQPPKLQKRPPSAESEASASGSRNLRREVAPVPVRTPGRAVATESSRKYRPLIRNYCLFCMTPHGQSPDVIPVQSPFEVVTVCRECDSPLFSPPADLLALARRAVTRFGRDEEITLHVDWPEPRVQAQVINISPTGLRCKTEWPIETGERVRIESSALRAVGEVAFHQRQAASASANRAITEAGIRFVTVAFEKPTGSFLSVTG